MRPHSIRDTRDIFFGGGARSGREGQVGKRTQKEIGMHALRMGSEIGLHTVYYASEFERLEFTHRASSRDVCVYFGREKNCF